MSMLVQSQIGGSSTYAFLDIPATARIAGNGGNSMSIWGNDINTMHSNPALLNPSMSKQAAFNYCNYVSDINFYQVAYAHQIKDKGTAAYSIQAFNYGNFIGYDELGNKTNNFKASDYSLNMNFAKPMADSMFNIGICLKTIISQYDIYKSFGNAIDFGVSYHNKKNFTASLVAKNVGFVWKEYNNNAPKQTLPNTVQLGFSYKPSKAPFRFFMVYDQLLKWNLKYVSSVDTTGRNATFGSNETEKDSTGFQKFGKRFGSQAGNFMRHLLIGTEIVLSKNFNLRVAYNIRRQAEMTLPDRRGLNGLSFGFGLKVRYFSFSYAFSKMAFPGNSSMIGITYSW
jgi:hypothetical protein